MKRRRCAIYTRKSSEEGLEQDFNSLDAQREACEAYIASQRQEGWHCLLEPYDDGGFSGGSMDRPSLKRLLQDIVARKVDVVVVYKVDRLTRSLSDFAKIVEIFDRHDVSFVSVTQAFNTTTSMGRLTLNVLLSFAQYEREVTGERIRDKIAASKKKGLWMGGYVPAGYRADGRTLVILQEEAKIIRLIFQRYLELGTVGKLEAELIASGIHAPIRTTGSGRTIGGRPFSRGQLYKLLSNPIYRGEIQHKRTQYPGQHEAIVRPDVFDEVQRVLATNRQGHRTGRRSAHPSLLAGLLIDAHGDPLIASHATKANKRYRYYISRSLQGRRAPGRLSNLTSKGERSAWRIPAGQIERVVLNAIRDRLSNKLWLLDTAKLLMGADRLPSSVADRITKLSFRLCDRLSENEPANVRNVITRLIARIVIRCDHIVLEFDRKRSADSFGIDLQLVAQAKNAVRYKIPMTLHRKGVETKLVMNEGGQAVTEPDQTIVRAIARAKRWMSDLIDGQHSTVTKLAQAYSTDPRYIARHLPLACLAPKVVDAIVEGRQPPELTTWDLLNRIDLPLCWDEQIQLLGFAQSTFVQNGPPNLPEEKTGR